MNSQAVGAIKPDAGRIAAAQRLRLRRLLLASFGWLMYLGIAAYFRSTGALALTPPIFAGMALGVLVVNLGFVAWILSGRNLRLRDPSFTGIHISVAIAFLLGLLWFAETLLSQDFFLLGLIITLLFGSFKLGLRELVPIAILGYGGYSVAFFLHSHEVGLAFHDSVARIAMYGILVAWVTFFAAYVSGLRARLADRNQALRETSMRLREVATHDGLTGLYNRRRMDELLSEERERAERTQLPFVVAMLDLDHFKRINDAYGHAVGDEVLQDFVCRVNAEIRRIDWLGVDSPSGNCSRWGGEEFLLLLGNATIRGGARVVERILRAVSSTAIQTSRGPISLAVSAGLARYCPGESVDKLLRRADAALYRAKRKGRNCYVLADAPKSVSGDAHGPENPRETDV